MPRFTRLGLFAMLASGLAILGLALGIAWVYVYGLTHPWCNPNPQPQAGELAPEEVWLRTADGLSLRAWYYPPRAGELANGATIIALGGTGGALGQNLPPVDFLIRAGFGVLQVDSRACARPAAAVTLGADELLDAEAALAYLQDRPEAGRLGVFGFSMGGVTAIRAAARYPQIEAVVAEGGYYNMGQDFIDADRAMPVFERAFLYLVAGVFRLQSGVNPFTISPVDDLPAISPRPVLLIYGSREIASGRGQAQFAAARPPKELWVVAGGEHGTNDQAAGEEYRRRVLEFFSQALGR